MFAWRYIVLITLCLSVFVACDEQPEDRPRFIDRFRVIGLRSVPLTAQRNQDVTLEVLARSPQPSEFSATWSWCPYRAQGANQYKCPVDEARYRELIEQAATRFDFNIPESTWGKIPAFELGKDADALFKHGLSKQEATILCGLTALAAVEVDTSLQANFHSVSCDQSFEVSLRASVTDLNSGDRLVTRKSMFIHTGAFDPLRHPEVVSLQIRPAYADQSKFLSNRLDWIDADKPHDEQWVDFDKSIKLLRGFEYEVIVKVSEDSLDIFRPHELDENREEDDTPSDPKDDDNPFGPGPDKSIAYLERLNYRWFRTLDVLDRRSKRERDAPDDDDRDGPDFDRFLNVQPLRLTSDVFINLTSERNENLTEVCTSYPCQAWLAVLVQDKQLGATWRTMTFEVIE